MGVMLSLDQEQRQIGGRRAAEMRLRRSAAPTRLRRGRRGQHTRTTEDQACLDALAAFLRADAPTAGRCLSKLSADNLTARLLPAARALAQAASLMLAESPEAGRRVELDYVLSPACLLGTCAGPAAGTPGGTVPCSSTECQHSCHGRPRPQTYSVGIASHFA